MNWIFLTLGAVFFFTSLNLLQRIIATGSTYPRATAVVFNVYAAFLAAVTFIITGGNKSFSLPHDVSAYLFLAIACLFYGLYERLRFKVSKLLTASLFSTIGNLSVLVAFLVALVLYSESFTPTKFIGVALVLSALFLVSYHKHETASKTGIFWGIVASVILGVAWGLDKKGATFFTPNTYSILVWTLPLLVIYLPYVPTHQLVHEARKSSWKLPLIAAFNVVGYLLQLQAVTLAEATRVIPVVQTSTVFTILLGIILLNEREHLVRNSIAGVLSVAGVFFLV